MAADSPVVVWQPDSVRQATPQFYADPRAAETRIQIRQLDDIVKARRAGRLLASQMGCSGSRVALVLTAISELARNIITYANCGEILLTRSKRGFRESLVVVGSDQGPGIADVSSLTGQPVAGSCGTTGLSGLKQCMDRFTIESAPGAGTRVTCEVFSN